MRQRQRMGELPAPLERNPQFLSVDKIHCRSAGRIGWCAKGIVYGLIGGLCCRGAVSTSLQDTSPQGAFILLGAPPALVHPLLRRAHAHVACRCDPKGVRSLQKTAPGV